MNCKILSSKLNKFFKKKSKQLHTPIFFGNEIKYLKDCIDTGYVSYVGKFVEKFEKKLSKYTKSKFTVATSSGTAGLHLVLNYLNINIKHEVLLPSYTYVATANTIKYCGADPHFVDIETDTLGICPKKLENYLKSKTLKSGNKTINRITKKEIKALILVHVYGFPGKVLEIKKICKKYNIYLIEDAAEAMGSFFKKKHLGTFGDFGVLSFNGNKPITTGGGGAILTKLKKHALALRHLSTHAKKNVKFDHIHDKIGFNYRMINISAAVGCAQLENLSKIISSKRKNYIFYKNFFKRYKNLKILSEPKNSKCNYWLITLIFDNKKLNEQFLKELSKKGFGIRKTWRPLHTLKIFKHCQSDTLNNSKKIFENSLNLPSSPFLQYK